MASAEKSKRWRQAHPKRSAESSRAWAKRNPLVIWLGSIRRRAKKKSIPFELTVDDLVIPEYCPVLGIPIFQANDGSGKPKDNSPSVDRIVPELGYVPGNVVIMSYRANRIKNNSTPEELMLVALWSSINTPKV